ncbi:nucleotide sugar dehydrogenase [Dietzia sp. SLG310A2-38A2]|uniref:nucleotide sugar dehydrogenase n=1 Tax=Dietzia sp. SLG310A2-38A2 TaxID=1630643 RepID=UPI0015F8F0BC|nr:nucleotide sugar dehydrogenase [Dietzia sp. SLG310A2-38A2]MBB1030050.1 nucleotide sugar dehydrogenase [Dietzia sp. SLG310A2-38A2]
MSKVVVFGQGYVGLPMALRASAMGHEVIGLDTNQDVVNDLNNGKSHIDDVSDIDLSRGITNGYSATTDPASVAAADVVVVCVPTPLADSGGPDLSAVETVGKTIGMHVSSNTLCILESTTYPGTTEEIFLPLVSRGELVLGKDIFVAFSPERIDPGNETYGIHNTPKVVGGLTQECTQRAIEFYGSFVDTVVAAKGAKEAEMAKLLENTFRHVNIALVNEMVRFSNELDIDLWDAIDAAATKPFGFMPFRPGPGVGGHCIPVDPSYLSHRVKAKLGYAFRMVELAEEINHAAPIYVAERARSLLNDCGKPVRRASVLLIGVSYKPDISDQRESPAVPLASRLRAWGAEVSYHDPHVPEWSPYGSGEAPLRSVELNGSPDLIILLQNHKAVDLASISDMRCPLLDTRAVVPVVEGVHRL